MNHKDLRKENLIFLISIDSLVVMLNEDKTMLKRKHPIPENLNTDARTVYLVKIPSIFLTNRSIYINNMDV